MSKARRPKPLPNHKQTFALVYWIETNEISVLDSRCVIDKEMLTDNSKQGMVEFGEPSISSPPGGWPRFVGKVLAVSENETHLRKLEDDFIKNGKLNEVKENTKRKRTNSGTTNNDIAEGTGNSSSFSHSDTDELSKQVTNLEKQLEEEKTKNSTLMNLNWRLQEALLNNLKGGRTNCHQESKPFAVTYTLLLTYGENKRKIHLIEEKCNLKGLREEVTKDKRLSDLLGNPDEILFQIFNEEFEEYIDLESTDEIPNISKIKAIRMTALATNAELPLEKDINAEPYMHTTLSSSDEIHVPEVAIDQHDERMDGLSTDSERSRSLYLYSDQDDNFRSYRILSTDYQNFELPPFSKLVEECLKQNKILTATVRKKIIETLYEKIASQTIYPGSHMYHNVVTALILKYPCLRDRTGNGYHSWLTALRNKFRNERKKFHGAGIVEDMRRRYGKANRMKPSTSDEPFPSSNSTTHMHEMKYEEPEQFD